MAITQRWLTGRARFWRSPEGQPRWARPALLGVAALAGVLYTARIGEETFAIYYAPAVRSMSGSWHAFVLGAFDPAATVTLDKLAGSFLPQALAVRLLGFHGWVLALPQAVEGVLTVLVLYRMVRRWQGPAAGLLAAGLLALTPIAASAFGHPMEDALLVLALVLAADAVQAALVTGRLRSLLLAGVWVGVGFQAKMLQAWLVVPALGLAYLLCAPGPVRRRMAHVGAFGLVTLAVSTSWAALITLTPAEHRPYVDGSTSNSAFAMAFGYNGIGRLGLDLPGAVAAPIVGSSAGPKIGPGGEQTWTKLIEPGYGSQVGWLYPVAVLGLVLGLVRPRIAERPDDGPPDAGPPEDGSFQGGRGGLVLWGLWLVTFGAVISAVHLPHTAYLLSLAPPVAALSAAGTVLAWRAARDGGPGRWLLPAIVVVELVWTAHLSGAYPTFLPWLIWAAAAAAGLSSVVLVATGVRAGRTPGSRRSARAAAVAAAVGIAAMLVTPAAWSATVLQSDRRGSAFDASAGPVPQLPDLGDAYRTGAAPGPLTVVESVDRLSPDRRTLIAYLTAHREGADYLAAVDGGLYSGPLIAATGLPFLPMGGFSWRAPHPTLQQVQDLVATGRLHYFVLDPALDGAGKEEPTAGDTTVVLLSVVRWAQATCTDVTEAALPGDATAPVNDAAEAAVLTVLRC